MKKMNIGVIGAGFMGKAHCVAYGDVPKLFPDEPIMKNDMEGIYAVYEDEMYQYQTARDGYVISTYLQKIRDGEVISEQKVSQDTYKPQPDGYYVGIKSRDEEE